MKLYDFFLLENIDQISNILIIISVIFFILAIISEKKSNKFFFIIGIGTSISVLILLVTSIIIGIA